MLQDAFLLVSSTDRAISLGWGLTKLWPYSSLKEKDYKEAVTRVPGLIEFLVSENCYIGLNILFSCME